MSDYAYHYWKENIQYVPNKFTIVAPCVDPPIYVKNKINIIGDTATASTADPKLRELVEPSADTSDTDITQYLILDNDADDK